MRTHFPLIIGLFALLLIAASSEDSSPPQGVIPHVDDSKYLPPTNAVGIMDLAPEYRQRNRGGSCVHASTTMLLRWQGQHELADRYWNTYRGGESPGPHERKLKQMGIRYAMTDDGDEQLVEYALATRRGFGCTWSPMHVICCVGRVERNGQLQAVLLDNNRIDRFLYQPWDQFMREWKRRGGWAFVVIYTPPPPTPLS